MKSLTARTGVLLAFLGVFVATWCAAIATVTAADPVSLGEIGGGVLVSVWLLMTLRSLLRSRRLSVLLDAASQPALVAGVSCRVISGPGRHAFVLGILRPTIYVGADLLLALDSDELSAVLLHEDHHRRTHAPLRAASLESWVRLAAPSHRLREALSDRLADLERDADAWAISRGATRSAIARALLKTTPGRVGGATLFSASPDRRLRALVDPTPLGARLPYEWLPLAVLLVLTAACHAIGTTGL